MRPTKYGHRAYSLQEDANDDDTQKEETTESTDTEETSDSTISDYELKQKALKLGIDITKLMSDATPDDMVDAAKLVCDFVRNHEIGGAAETTETAEETEQTEDNGETEETTDETEDFTL